MTLIPCILSDMDDTLADPTHRMALRPTGDAVTNTALWNKFHDLMPQDAPHQDIIDYVLRMANFCPAKICIITGRPANYYRQTLLWLRDHGIRHVAELLMRARQDYRPQLEIKRDLIQELKNQGYWPLVALEDEKDVCDMYYGLGIPVRQVINGQYRKLRKPRHDNTN